jgi:hypothetical protein
VTAEGLSLIPPIRFAPSSTERPFCVGALRCPLSLYPSGCHPHPHRVDGWGWWLCRQRGGRAWPSRVKLREHRANARGEGDAEPRTSIFSLCSQVILGSSRSAGGVGGQGAGGPLRTAFHGAGPPPKTAAASICFRYSMCLT